MSVTDRRRRQRSQIIYGAYPQTLSTGRTQCHTGAKVKHPPPTGPRSRKLTPHQADVLELLRVGPRTMSQLGDALNIEWSMAAWAADCLVNRGLAEIVADAPVRPTWRAVA